MMILVRTSPIMVVTVVLVMLVMVVVAWLIEGGVFPIYSLPGTVYICLTD